MFQIVHDVLGLFNLIVPRLAIGRVGISVPDISGFVFWIPWGSFTADNNNISQQPPTTPPSSDLSDLVMYFAFRFIYETESFNGIGELLEILGR